MAINNPYAAYQNNSVNTASPGELTLMLYNGSLKFIHIAKKAIEDKNIELKNTNIQKIQAIVNELMVTLNTDLEVSQNLMSLYDYINHRLTEANIKNDVSILEEVEGLITDFRDTWKEVIQLNRQKQHARSRWSGVMSSVLLCYTITKQLIEALEQVNDENRESTIEEVEALLEKRQSVLGTIKPPYTQDEQKLR